jgi:hypothetical protein
VIKIERVSWHNYNGFSKKPGACISSSAPGELQQKAGFFKTLKSYKGERDGLA